MSSNQTPIHPGRYVKESLIPNGVSVKKAAEMMGIGRPALSNFLNGKANLSSSMAVRLENAFGANKEELLELQQNYDAFLNRDEESRIAVKSYTPSFLKITASHIDQWADKIDTRPLLPVLIRRLVNTTGRDLISSYFPGYDDSQTKGWDGEVEAQSATPWVPSGVSGWEFGCDKDPRQKANKDYLARTKIPAEERQKTTFIFITPRRWKAKNDWHDEHKKKGEWKDIRVFDAVDIEQWLEMSIPAQIWLAEQLGVQRNGCQSLDDFWARWSGTAQPAISSKIFDSAVSDYGETVKKWYQDSPDKPLIISAASKEEAKAFLCCVTDQADLHSLKDKAVFIDSSETVKKLSEISTRFVPIAFTDDVQEMLVPLYGQRHSLIVADRNIKGIEPEICLDLPNYDSFKKALEDMGFDEANIEILANQTSHSPTILRRILAKIPALKKPSWATTPERLKAMVPFVFAGAWDCRKESDKEILSYFTDKSYEDIEKDIAELASIDDAPLWSEGKFRGVVSELECFIAISDFLTEEMLDRFFYVAEYVLSEDDPALDLEKDKRWAANIYNKVRDHSPVIRRSICQNLIIMAVHGNALVGKRLGVNIETRVGGLIRALLHNKDPRVWQSQQSDLPAYAEAAPETFLSIIEEELRKKTPAFKDLFEPVESGPFSSCDRTGMLWALEMLAWNPARLSRVVAALGKLSTYELDDNWANKPINSLIDILLVWRPHTAASLEDRCEVLEFLCNEVPEIGWKICIQTLEPGSSFTSGTHKPSWRSDASGALKAITYGEIDKFSLKCLDIILLWKTHTVSTLKDLINCMIRMDEKHKKLIVEQVKKWLRTNPTSIDVITLREHVRTRTMTTRALKREKFHKNDGNKNYVCGKELYELLQPKDVVLNHQWLFANSWVEYTPEELENDDFDYEYRSKRLEEDRKNALKDIIEQKGTDGVFELLKLSNSGEQIGSILQRNILTKEDVEKLILEILARSDIPEREADNCLAGILFAMDEEVRSKLIYKFDESLRQEDVLRVLKNSPFGGDTWNILDEIDEKYTALYWQQICPNWCDKAHMDYAVRKLLEVKRPNLAFQLAHYNFGEIDSKIIFNLLESFACLSSEDDTHFKPSKYDIEEAFIELNKRRDVEKNQLVQLEYLYVDALYSNSRYGFPNLSKAIAESPLLFIQLVAYAFKSRGGKKEPEDWNMPEDEDKKRIVATKSFHILDHLMVMPGTDKEGSINVQKLRDWIMQVRELAREYGRGDITDQKIGKMLSISKVDDDGIWPQKEIRTVFEEIASEHISTGMQIGLRNSRGAEWRGADSSKERSKAKTFEEMAEKIRNKLPFTANMLREIARSYIREAEWWDEDARVNKRLGRF